MYQLIQGGSAATSGAKQRLYFEAARDGQEITLAASPTWSVAFYDADGEAMTGVSTPTVSQVSGRSRFYIEMIFDSTLFTVGRLYRCELRLMNDKATLTDTAKTTVYAVTYFDVATYALDASITYNDLVDLDGELAANAVINSIAEAVPHIRAAYELLLAQIRTRLQSIGAEPDHLAAESRNLWRLALKYQTLRYIYQSIGNAIKADVYRERFSDAWQTLNATLELSDDDASAPVATSLAVGRLTRA